MSFDQIKHQTRRPEKCIALNIKNIISCQIYIQFGPNELNISIQIGSHFGISLFILFVCS